MNDPAHRTLDQQAQLETQLKDQPQAQPKNQSKAQLKAQRKAQKIANKKAEKRALLLSLFGTLIASGSGLAVGFLVNSQAILLDGIFSLLSMGMTGLALYTTQLIHRPDDDTFQFGYSHLEPLTTVLQGFVILAICLVAFITGVRTLLNGGSAVHLDFALVYAVLMTVLCFAIYFFERRIAGASKSELIKVDSQEWLIDGILSSTLLLGFILAMVLERMNYGDLKALIDPVLTMVLALFASVLPIRVIGKNMREVLLVSPAELNDRVQDSIEQIVDEYEFADYSCHFAKTGRQYDLEINLLVDDPDDWTIDKQDEFRQVIYDRLVSKLGKTWLTISFTACKKWL